MDIDKAKIHILGNGYLGREFAAHGYTNTASDKFRYDPANQTEQDIDNILMSIPDVAEADAIVNCIGISNTRDCENQRYFNLYALPINGNLPGILSRFCKRHHKRFVHISTGCLYDNRGKGLCKETDLIAAHCNYTLSKWIGELGCNRDDDLIIRPRLFFSDTSHQSNLICKFARFDKILNEFNSVTSLETIIESVEQLLYYDQAGVFNVANDGAYTIKQLSEFCGYKWQDSQVIYQEDLHRSQGLYLVNNVMDISKLKEFYWPTDAKIDMINYSRQIKHDIKMSDLNG